LTVLLEAEKLSKHFGAFRALDGADLQVDEGEIVGLIGPNGAGKSTFFNCLVGDLAPTAGRVVFDGRDLTRATPEQHARLGMGRTFQVPATFEDMSVVENIMVGAFLRHPERRAARAAAEKVVEQVGLGDLAGARARTLGTPGRKRLEIARVLATGPRLMLLDEALAGLTPTEIVRAIELVRQIHASGVTIVIVEHIMEVILSLAGRIIVFNQGRIIAAGAPREVVDDPAVIEAYLGHSLRRGQKRAGP
jgi:branched-chain amino acid transport system ATP-binding protein